MIEMDVRVCEMDHTEQAVELIDLRLRAARADPASFALAIEDAQRYMTTVVIYEVP